MTTTKRPSKKNQSSSCAGQTPHVYDAFGVELQALKMAIGLAAELGVVRLIIETDALLVVQALNWRKPDFSREAQVIEDIKVQTSLWFSMCEITHCSREVNYAAHCLVQLGLNYYAGEVLVYDDDVPAELTAIVSGDTAQVVS